MNHVSAEHRRRNQVTRGAWDDYAPHRRIVTELLIGDRPARRYRLCVLGAGNVNDLDLAALLGAFREVHLVDLDREALAAGVARQGMEASTAIQLHGGFDLSGIFDRLNRWSPSTPPSDAEFAAALAAARGESGAAPRGVPGPFDVVASTCLLSQLIDSVAIAVDARHPRFVELLLTVRDRHLGLLVELTAPGGQAVLVTDVVSSDTCAEMLTVADAEIAALVSRLIAERNFFTGANPFLLKAWFEKDAAVSPLVERVELMRPWRWRVGPRAYAVCAIRVERRAV